jgi:hypothetical protein
LRVSLPISLLDKANGVFGTSDLGKDHLTLFQTPPSLNGILRMRGEPEIVLIEVIE